MLLLNAVDETTRLLQSAIRDQAFKLCSLETELRDSIKKNEENT